MSTPVAKVQYQDKELVYAVANDHTAWRVRSMWTKEPDTIAWIEGMAPGETFVDIGANMGIYTVFAMARGLRVYAFEPEAENYNLLCRSIRFNEGDASAYCVALSDHLKADYLYLSGYLAGGSCHTFGENVGHKLTQREHEFKQGCIAIPLDRFMIKADHIKIDVDGLEHTVISGAPWTVSNAKSVLIEINQNLPQHMELVERMQAMGFKYDPEQVKLATRKEGTFKDCGNWIFRR